MQLTSTAHQIHNAFFIFVLYLKYSTKNGGLMASSSSTSSNASDAEDKQNLQKLKSSIDAGLSSAKQKTAEIKGVSPKLIDLSTLCSDFMAIYKSINAMKTLIDKMKTNPDDKKKIQLNNELKELDEKEVEVKEFDFAFRKKVYNCNEESFIFYFVEMNKLRTDLCHFFTLKK